MSIITKLQERRQVRAYKVAAPLIADTVKLEREVLLNFFKNSRQLDKANLVKRLDDIKYDKPWPKGTTLDQAFELAVHEAITIVEDELRK